MKIIIDARTATSHFPGIGRYVSNLLKSMAALQDEMSLHIIRSPAPIGYPVAPAYKATTTNASVFSFSQQWVIPKLIDKAGGSLYHSAYYLMPYRVKIPVVFTCYDLIPIVYPIYFSPLQRAIYRIAHLIAAKVSSHIIAISESTKSDLTRFFSVDEQKISVIPLAADIAFTPQSTDRIEAVQIRYGLPRRYCLYVGTNKPHKNLLGLLKAWKLLHDEKALEGHSLVIAGHWDSRYPEARGFALSSGLDEFVKFLGKVGEEHLPALYSGATVFVQPSLYEGFGLPIIEAMSCGAPVACSNTSSLPEVAGDAAMLFDPKDPKSIAVTLGALIADSNKLGTLAERSIQQASNFSWQQTALHTIEVYRKVYLSQNTKKERIRAA
jgi:alpha-1,3-rhamnosyl/mannosyltransferase